MFLESNFDVIKFEEIDSTNEEAKRLIRSGVLSKSTVITSKTQALGHGRYGRSWVSEEGNLYTSIIIKLDSTLDKAAQYSFIASIAVGETIRSQIDSKFKIEYKWPNDVLIDGKKVSGILLESLKDNNSNHWLIIGVGVNINNCPQLTDKEVVCLSDVLIGSIDIYQFLNKLIYNFESQENLWKNQGFSCIRATWFKNAHRLGEEITVNLLNEKFKGKFEGINDNGELEVDVDGKKHFISSGEVFF